ncbi:MAG: hypothetical protein K0R41_3390 [Geminicoccaceae bacterium]|jgi:hypothetical protein|nr:hypothetical protein [Geminicoccaceae bacterium]MCE3249565.1 hypothetical protein [Geminicoccaceae bacterium]
MTMTRTGSATALALALMMGAAATAVAQSATEDPHHPGTAPQAGSEPTRPSTPGSGPQGMMMDPQVMHEMMRQMMAQGMMGPGMGPGMMQQMPGMMDQGPQGQRGPGMMQQMPGMMGQGMMGQMPGHGAMGGWRITPVMHLGIEDVQHYLEHVIEAHELQHLKIGEVRQTDDDTITADLVTQEGSLALQLEVDRHTGVVRKVS